MELVKVELGCGTRKTKGYIGIDRFNFPDVDIVADIDNGIPLDDNSVDVIFCAHSLEHFSNLENIMKEIFRVCKHKAIVNILAPYHMESVNLSNIYHKQVFNESTFRFFTSDSNLTIEKRDYYNPHASFWGLANSDNSQQQINFYTLSMEFFYFPSYLSLTEDEKRNARKSLINVCDQIYYSLTVNKSNVPFTLEEIDNLRKNAREQEVPVLEIIRNREHDNSLSCSLIDDIKKWDSNILIEQEKIGNKFIEDINDLLIKIGIDKEEMLKQLVSREESEKKFQGIVDEVKELNDYILNKIDFINSDVQYLETKLSDLNKFYCEKIIQLEEKCKGLEANAFIIEKLNSQITLFLNKDKANANTIANHTLDIEKLQKQVNIYSIEKDSIVSYILDIIKSKEKNKISIFRKNNNLFNSIQQMHIYFVDGLIIHNKNFKRKSLLSLSYAVPYEGYVEYKLRGYGNKINFFLLSNIGAKLFIEVVMCGKIVKQESFTVTFEGMYTCILQENVQGEAYIRFKTLDNLSIARVLEIRNRFLGVFAKKDLAAFIE